MTTRTTSSRLGAALAAGALAAFLGASAADAATTPPSQQAITAKCDARATKRKLDGDKRQAYLDRCMRSSMSAKKKPGSAAQQHARKAPPAGAPASSTE